MTQPAPGARRASSRLLTVKATAEQLRLSEKTVRRLIANGDLTAHRIGARALRVSEEDLSLFLLRRRG